MAKEYLALEPNQVSDGSEANPFSHWVNVEYGLSWHM